MKQKDWKMHWNGQILLTFWNKVVYKFLFSNSNIKYTYNRFKNNWNITSTYISIIFHKVVIFSVRLKYNICVKPWKKNYTFYKYSYIFKERIRWKKLKCSKINVLRTFSKSLFFKRQLSAKFLFWKIFKKLCFSECLRV